MENEPAAHSHLRALLALRHKVISGVTLFFLFFTSCLPPLTGIQEIQSNLETATWHIIELRQNMLCEKTLIMWNICHLGSHSLASVCYSCSHRTDLEWAEMAAHQFTQLFTYRTLLLNHSTANRRLQDAASLYLHPSPVPATATWCSTGWKSGKEVCQKFLNF